MGSKTGFPVIKSLFKKMDWQLLLFLLLVLNVKLAVKVAAVIMIYLLNWNFSFGFNIKKSRLPLFYLMAIIISFINLIVFRRFLNINYDVAFISGIGFWILSVLIIHQIKLFAEKNDMETIHQTLIIFFIINAFVSLINLGAIVLETGAINPYLYQGQFQKYFISTGDYIKGISFDTSTTNALINAFGVVYFLTKRNMQMVLLCMIILILTASNFTSLILMVVFALLFVFRSDAVQKSMMVICTSLLIIFLAKISPQNHNYVADVFGKVFHEKKPELQTSHSTPPKGDTQVVKIIPALQYVNSVHANIVNKEMRLAAVIKQPEIISSLKARTRPEIPEPNINRPFFQQKNDTSAAQYSLLGFINANKRNLPLCGEKDYELSTAGKLIAFRQTVQFFQQHPEKIFFGDGLGNFSSKLAYRITGLKMEGGYPARFSYISPDFLRNHLDVYLFVFSNKKGLHSIINTPDSVFDQLLAEYGIAGTVAFFIFYLGFFFKETSKRTYSLPLGVLLFGAFAIGYWFEQLSVVILFELLMFMDFKGSTKKNIAVNEAR